MRNPIGWHLHVSSTSSSIEACLVLVLLQTTAEAHFSCISTGAAIRQRKRRHNLCCITTVNRASGCSNEDRNRTTTCRRRRSLTINARYLRYLKYHQSWTAFQLYAVMTTRLCFRNAWMRLKKTHTHTKLGEKGSQVLGKVPNIAMRIFRQSCVVPFK